MRGGCGRSLRRLFERHANQRVEAGIGAQFRARSRDRRACFAGLEAEAGEGGDGVGEGAGGGPGWTRTSNSAERPGLVLQSSEEHTSELQSLMRLSFAVFCLKKTRVQTLHTV